MNHDQTDEAISHGMVRIPCHLESQKFQTKQYGPRLTLTFEEARLLFQLQYLMNSCQYSANSSIEIPCDSNAFYYKGSLPVFRFKRSALYGMPDGSSLRSNYDQRRLIDTLWNLSHKKFHFQYAKKSKNGKTYRVNTISNLFALMDDVGDYLESADQLHGRRFLTLAVAPIVVDQIESYFLLKPSDYYARLKAAIKKIGKTRLTQSIVAFCDWLYYMKALRKRNKNHSDLSIGLEALSRNLYLSEYYLSGNYKRLCGMIDDMAAIAYYMGLLQPLKYRGSGKNIQYRLGFLGD